MKINEIQDAIVEEFVIFDDWMDRYSYLIELGNELPDMDADRKTEQTVIEGCQSKVWIDAEYDNGIINYFAESDAIIVKGIVALLLRVFSGQSVTDIMNSDLYFIEKIGLSNHLSPTRSNGLLSMVKQMKLYAIAFNAKYQQ
jgi:cysteine desulfuration protein SufE